MMMTMTITPLYAGPLALLFLILSLRVIGRRRMLQVGLGDGGDPDLARRIRVAANCGEYIPLVLILMVLAELQGATHFLLHATGAALLAGRALHAYGVSHAPENYRYRTTGMILTIAALVTAMSATFILGVMQALG
ncbi:MAPEG family protein [Dongia mobilis]|uniref:MAPEG family protein n=1 Tax=Dongia sp. TaxID=1977262 RepID=UPI0026E93887